MTKLQKLHNSQKQGRRMTSSLHSHRLVAPFGGSWNKPNLVQIIAEATATAYKGAINEVQAKVRRVVEVWRQRQIFELSIQEAVEARISGQSVVLKYTKQILNCLDLDKSRSSGRKPLLGGSLFSSSSGPSAPAELQPLVPLQIAVSKAIVTLEGSIPAAKAEFDKLMDPATAAPTPPVHAARLSALLKSLANAEGAVSESIKARLELIGGLEKLLETNRAALSLEQAQHEELSSRRTVVEAKKRDVEDGIMRGLSAEASVATIEGKAGSDTQGNGQHDTSAEPERPQVEELTPPPIESLTPVGSPGPASNTLPSGSDVVPERQNQVDSSSATQPPQMLSTAQVGFDLLSSLAVPPARNYMHSPTNGFKKRKIEPEFGDFMGGDAMEGLDEDVAELLRAESGGR